MSEITLRRAAVYLRISQDKTGEGLGVERQREDCEELAAKLGWSVTFVFDDNDMSGYSERKRPGFEEMRKAIRDGMVDAVIAWSLDRLSRQPMFIEEFLLQTGKLGALVHTVKDGRIDFDSATGRFGNRVMNAATAFYIDQNVERLKRQKLQAALDGKYRGGPRPFGYEQGGIEIRESEAALVREATRSVLAGASLRSVVIRWSEEGVVSSLGKPFTVTGVRSLLMRWRNAGRVERHGLLLDGHALWKPIVSEDELTAIRALLSGTDRRTTTARARRWLGSGIFVCVCGSPVRCSGTGVSSKGQRRMVYRCRWATDNPGQIGQHASRDAMSTDLFVESAMIERLGKPEALALLAPEGVDLSALRAEQNVVEAQLIEVADLFTSGVITNTQLRTMNSSLITKNDALSAQLKTASANSDLAEFALTDDVPKRWKGTDIETRGRLVDALAVVRILPGKGRSGRGQYFDPELIKIEWRARAGSDAEPKSLE